MSKELVIDVKANEIDIALLEDKKLVELNKEKSNPKFSVGDIYLGKVKKIMPGLNAAFVDVGYEKDAFLHYLDLGPQFRTLQNFLHIAVSRKTKLPSMQKLRKEPDIDKNGRINDVLATGQLVLVQIAKEPISTKGPRLTSEIAIAGRHLVVMPLSDKVSVSQKIESTDEKKRLRTLINSIKPNNYGVIVRTVAEGKMVRTLDEELRNLTRKWEASFEKIRNAKPPRLILSELNRTAVILRDVLSVSFNNIHINDESLHREIKEYINTIAPEKEKIVNLYTGNTPIFEKFDVLKQIKASFGKTVSFKSGAYLIVEHTEALHVIDVNSGNRAKNVNNQESTALEVNLAACDEIARQLRLRDMGGIIVIDFIDMQNLDNKNKVFERMKDAMEGDRTKHSILPLSRFGLMQITRQRVRPEMHINTRETCPTCEGTGEISPSVLIIERIESHLADLLEQGSNKKITIRVHPFIAAYINKGLISNIRKKWKRKYGVNIGITAISSYDFLEFHFFDKTGEEIYFETK
ncbi:MAG: Rne/Rng family ribonuclease [Bacteroidales bacterium]|nr:Rne/Rng family ribonuclease [Bacteroidales bacterium]MBN2819325.1 Rne/Rng family ribonuclease [Bacteroidales bacterium]